MKKQINKFEVGDWCFSDYKLNQVLEVSTSGRVTQVTTGSINVSGGDIVCFPLELEVKIISNAVEYWSNRFFSLIKRGINFSLLSKELYSRWEYMCNRRDDEDVVKRELLHLNNFGKKVVEAVENGLPFEVRGVSIYL